MVEKVVMYVKYIVKCILKRKF